MNDIDPYNTINILHSSKHKMKSINDGEKTFIGYTKNSLWNTVTHIRPVGLPIYYFNEQEGQEEAIKEWCFSKPNAMESVKILMVHGFFHLILVHLN